MDLKLPYYIDMPVSEDLAKGPKQRTSYLLYAKETDDRLHHSQSAFCQRSSVVSKSNKEVELRIHT